MSESETSTQTERTEVRRAAPRGHYDRETIDAILDEAVICHLGTIEGEGSDALPVVIPTLFARDGDHVLFHGSAAARSLRSARDQEVCLTVTLVDGFVIARSAFHHSMNYRSVVVLGRPEQLEGEDKVRALDVLVERLVPGRLEQLATRPMTDKEIRATTVLRLPLTEASAKVRTGGPIDDDEDYALPIWAGVLPTTIAYGTPVTDPASTQDIAVPDNITNYRRPSS